MLLDETKILSSLCRKSFVDFVKEFIEVVIPGGVKWNWHLDVFCEELQRMAERVFAGLPKEYDLVVNVAPGSTKSTIFSILFPAWVWTRMPAARICGASFSYLLALELSRKCRDVVDSEKYKQCFPEVQWRSDQNTKCLAKGTRVLLADGGLKRIEKLRVGDKVQSSDGFQVLADTVTGVFDSGIQKVYRILLSDGSTIRATARHRFYTWNQWSRVEDLRPGDAMCVVGKTLPQHRSVTTDDAFLVHDGRSAQIPPEWRDHADRGARSVGTGLSGWSVRKTVSDYAKQTGNEFLQRKLTGGLEWRQVVSIEPDGEVQTYDIETKNYHAFFAETFLSHNSHYVNTAGGMRYAVGTEGTVQGFHFHFIIIDDPVDPHGAISDAELNTTNYWIKNTLSGRKVDKLVTVTILVMQRLSQNDPTQLFLERKDVRHVCLPASLEFPVKPARHASKYVDGLMDPVRLPKAFLDAERSPGGMGEYTFAGQYGQQPIPLAGGKFDVRKILPGTPPARFLRTCRFWDKAATAAKGKTALLGPAFTVGVKGGLDGVRPADSLVWLLDVRRFRADSATREDTIARTASRDGKACLVGLEQEPGSGGKDSALATKSRLAKKGHRVKILVARGSKEVRADEFSIAVNSGRVRIPEEFWDAEKQRWTGWAADYIEELKYWPHSKFKDQGDASGGMFTCLQTGMVRAGPLPRPDAA